MAYIYFKRNSLKPSTNKNQEDNSLIILTIICAFSSFLFGWHVHEKAVLLILIPLSCLSIKDAKLAQLYFLMSFISNYSLFPLVFRVHGNYIIKFFLFKILNFQIYQQNIPLNYYCLSYALFTTIHRLNFNSSRVFFTAI